MRKLASILFAFVIALAFVPALPSFAHAGFPGGPVDIAFNGGFCDGVHIEPSGIGDSVQGHTLGCITYDIVGATGSGKIVYSLCGFQPAIIYEIRDNGTWTNWYDAGGGAISVYLTGTWSYLPAPSVAGTGTQSTLPGK